MNGLLVIDKPGGMTSHDVVSRLRKITGEKSIGHLGTLDPMATGVLPLLLGKFTRLAQYFSSAEKCYTGTIRFGFATDTYDSEGEPVGLKQTPALRLEEVRAAAVRFHGEISQRPPAFSAKKVGGIPAYKLARAGEAVELKPVTIHVSSFEIAELNGDQATFALCCSAGGYVRSVAHELGEVLGCGAHLNGLRRTRAGIFDLEDAHTLDDISDYVGDLNGLEELCCIHPRCLLPEMPAVCGDHLALGRLRNGAQANLPEFSEASLVKVFAGQRELVGIAKRIAGTLFQPVVVMG